MKTIKQKENSNTCLDNFKYNLYATIINTIQNVTPTFEPKATIKPYY